MYGLQTAPSPRRTNCKIQRNIKYKEDNFFWGGGEVLDENLNWNSHNNSHPYPYPYPHSYPYPLCYPYPCFSNAKFSREDCIEIKNKEWNAGEKPEEKTLRSEFYC